MMMCFDTGRFRKGLFVYRDEGSGIPVAFEDLHVYRDQGSEIPTAFEVLRGATVDQARWSLN